MLCALFSKFIDTKLCEIYVPKGPACKVISDAKP
jgi:hypothetical protein